MELENIKFKEEYRILKSNQRKQARNVKINWIDQDENTQESAKKLPLTNNDEVNRSLRAR
jgi:hypothetical protein